MKRILAKLVLKRRQERYASKPIIVNHYRPILEDEQGSN